MALRRALARRRTRKRTTELTEPTEEPTETNWLPRAPRRSDAFTLLDAERTRLDRSPGSGLRATRVRAATRARRAVGLCGLLCGLCELGGSFPGSAPRVSAAGALGMDAEQRCKSLMKPSGGQHELKATARFKAARPRPCGMEAVDELPHRTKVKLRKAWRSGASALASVMPNIQTCPPCIGDGDGRKLCILTQGGLYRSAVSGTRGRRQRRPPTPVEKSDRFVVAMKPAKAGGAKGATG
jgi:hypothetical protein